MSPLDFMPGYQADLVVSKGDEHRVVVVKSRGSLEAGRRIKELAKIIDSKPGWSLDWLLVATPERLDSPEGAHAFQHEDILRRIADAEQLRQLGLSDAALVLAWSAWEAAARLMLVEEGVPINGITTPNYVLEQATFLGVITREEIQPFN